MRWELPRLRNTMFCHPAIVESLSAIKHECTVCTAAGEIRVVSSPLCPTDEAWLFDQDGQIQRIALGAEGD